MDIQDALTKKLSLSPPCPSSSSLPSSSCSQMVSESPEESLQGGTGCSCLQMVSDLSEPPEELLQSDCCGSSCLQMGSDLPEPPEEPLQSDCCGSSCLQMGSDLPEPPEEPLQSDCCGTGCSPCVFDIYQEELEKWTELKQLSQEERKARHQSAHGGGSRGVGKRVALSTEEYREFEVVKMKQVTSDSFLYTFGLPGDCVLGVGVGEHLILRY